MLSFEDLLDFARESTAEMARDLVMMVKGLKADAETTSEQKRAYARILRQQADLNLAAAEELERGEAAASSRSL